MIDKTLLAQIKLHADLLCDSHTNKKQAAQLARLINSLQRVAVKRPDAKAFADALYKSSDAVQQDISIEDGQMIVLHTPINIDVKELAKHVLW